MPIVALLPIVLLVDCNSMSVRLNPLTAFVTSITSPPSPPFLPVESSLSSGTPVTPPSIISSMPASLSLLSVSPSLTVCPTIFIVPAGGTCGRSFSSVRFKSCRRFCKNCESRQVLLPFFFFAFVLPSSFRLKLLSILSRTASGLRMTVMSFGSWLVRSDTGQNKPEKALPTGTYVVQELRRLISHTLDACLSSTGTAFCRRSYSSSISR
mmetsp:Transcript_11349/g.30016  ORF Transcript_11349/g.30016 Transcript_11349/m.30016 type:complete len:210 (+) Transcript_11349:1619-2248(+)